MDVVHSNFPRMQRAEDAEPNTHMYTFRTKVCTKKRCRKPSKCLNAHSELMKRRVPCQNEVGLFNYIPEPCPQWDKEKKCFKGDNCMRSHGWLEVIFHPLLYRTKMCISLQRNGVCLKYGVYCAKAHKPDDLRNLVKIYGKHWKRHYDILPRERNILSSRCTNG